MQQCLESCVYRNPSFYLGIVIKVLEVPARHCAADLRLRDRVEPEEGGGS